MRSSALCKNTTENRLRAGWRIVGQQLLLVLTLLLLEDYATAPLKANLSQNGLLILDAITGILAFGISVWLAGRWLDHRPFADFGFHISRGWWIQLGFGAALGALLMGLIFLAERSLGYIQIIQFRYTVEPDASLAWALLVMFIHYIGISFTEEVLARGYLLRNLMEGFALASRSLTMALAVFVSSVIFALPHAGNPNATPVSTLLLVVFGVMCAMGVVLTGELAIPLGLHLTWNFFQGNVFGFPVSGWEMRGGTLIQIRQGGPGWFTGDAFGPEAGVVGLLAMLFGITLIVLWSRNNIRIGRSYVKREQLTA
jgi:membrane protease YdiL (CAAX protease family)